MKKLFVLACAMSMLSIVSCSDDALVEEISMEGNVPTEDIQFVQPTEIEVEGIGVPLKFNGVKL